MFIYLGIYLNHMYIIGKSKEERILLSQAKNIFLSLQENQNVKDYDGVVIVEALRLYIENGKSRTKNSSKRNA